MIALEEEDMEGMMRGHMDALIAQDTAGAVQVLIMVVIGVLHLADTMAHTIGAGVLSMIVIEGEIEDLYLVI